MIQKKRIFCNYQEELNFFEDKEKDISLIHLFPSLGWLTLLSHADLISIFSQFTAEELAIAWHGPESIKQTLLSNLTPEKRDQVLLFAEQVSPNRENSVFRELMISAEKALREKENIAI